MFETQALHSKSPAFIGDKKINLSRKEAVKAPAPSTAVAAGYAENHLFSHEIPPFPKIEFKKKKKKETKIALLILLDNSICWNISC